MIGPDKRESEWDKSLAKYQDRARDWPWSSMGLHFAIPVYNTYAFSVLGFLAHAARPNEKTRRAEEAGLRKAAPGPGVWAMAADL